ncbi:MAG TPA: organomercurial lyase [Bryobacteraceae bacterium]|jgi:hypothetical protein|nr:organomercurial lyase [Bryobacteraceae bacterium]
MDAAFDIDVRLTLYREFAQTGHAPTSLCIAQKLDTSVAEIRAALERLARGKAIVLQAESREVLMAAPFSVVPTPFLARTGDRSYFGSCVWDALGILAMLDGDGVIETSCACCGEAMAITIQNGHSLPLQGVIHFAIPAKRWWDNIVFT